MKVARSSRVWIALGAWLLLACLDLESSVAARDRRHAGRLIVINRSADFLQVRERQNAGAVKQTPGPNVGDNGLTIDSQPCAGVHGPAQLFGRSGTYMPAGPIHAPPCVDEKVMACRRTRCGFSGIGCTFVGGAAGGGVAAGVGVVTGGVTGFSAGGTTGGSCARAAVVKRSIPAAIEVAKIVGSVR